MPIIDYNPWSVVRQGQEASQAPYDLAAKEMANQKAKQEMASWLAEQTALKEYGQGAEVEPGLARPEEIRRLWSVAPNAAERIEKNRFADKLAGLRAGEIETAKIGARYKAMHDAGFDPSTGEPLGAQAVGLGYGPQIPREASESEIGVTRKRIFDPSTGTYKIETTREGGALPAFKQKENELLAKQWSDANENVSKLTDRLRTAAPNDIAGIKDELSFYTKRRSALQDKLGYEQEPSAPVPAPTAKSTALPARGAAAPPLIAGTQGTDQLSQTGREALITKQAESNISESQAERTATRNELIEHRKTAKDYAAVDVGVKRLQALAAIPTKDKDGIFVVDVRTKPGLLTGPAWGRMPSLSPQAMELDQITANLGFQNIPKGSGQVLNSEGERAIYERGQVQPINDPTTNYNASEVLRSQSINARDYPIFIESWVTNKKTRAGAEEFWNQYIEQNPNVVLDEATGIVQKNSARVPWHVAQKGEPAMDRYLDSKLKKGKLYPTPGGRMIYGGQGEFYTPEQWARGTR